LLDTDLPPAPHLGRVLPGLLLRVVIVPASERQANTSRSPPDYTPWSYQLLCCPSADGAINEADRSADLEDCFAIAWVDRSAPKTMGRHRFRTSHSSLTASTSPQVD